MPEIELKPRIRVTPDGWLFAVGLLLMSGIAGPLLGQQLLSGSVDWQMPTDERIRQTITEWIGLAENISDDNRQQLRELLDETPRLAATPLDNVARALPLLFPQTESLIRQLDGRPASRGLNWQQPLLLSDPALPDSVRQNLCLLAGRWLARHTRYEQALTTMAELAVEDVVDPAALLFYRGLSQHRLVRVEASVESLQQLLEHEDALPQRFASLGRLMLADMRGLESDSLDEIARIMQDVSRRQILQQSGTQVIGRQEDVIAKLDKLIEETQQKMQQQQQQQAARQAGPSSPMKDSENSGGRGDGKVAERETTEGGSWGNLPPRQRSAALVEMTRDLPPHYREVIEEYFRQLARENADQ